MKMIQPCRFAVALFALFAAMAGCTSGKYTRVAQGFLTRPARRTTASSSVRRRSGNIDHSGPSGHLNEKPIVADKANTFTLEVPRMSTPRLTRVKSATSIFLISRGKEFKQSVKLEFKAPAGVTVTPAMATIPAGQDKVTVTIEATNAAPAAGKSQLEVMAVPETGKSVALEIPVEVKHAS